MENSIVAIKQALLELSSLWVNQRRQGIEITLKSIELSLKQEDKNTSGDKHHTARAMLQKDRENAGKQLFEIEQLEKTLQQISLTKSTHVRLGSLVTTNQGIFFVCISKGMTIYNNTTYFIIGTQAPVAKAMLGKQERESFNFNDKTYTIIEIH